MSKTTTQAPRLLFSRIGGTDMTHAYYCENGAYSCRVLMGAKYVTTLALSYWQVLDDIVAHMSGQNLKEAIDELVCCEREIAILMSS